METKLQSGLQVAVYEEPYTQENFEGIARLDKLVNDREWFDGHKMDRWSVRMYDGSRVDRIVSDRDVIDLSGLQSGLWVNIYRDVCKRTGLEGRARLVKLVRECTESEVCRGVRPDGWIVRYECGHSETRIVSSRDIVDGPIELIPEHLRKAGQLTIADVKRRNAQCGHFYFSRDTLKFFDSRVERNLRRLAAAPNRYVLFLTSERPPHGGRAWTVRIIDWDSGDVETVGPFCEMTRSQAVDALREYASVDVDALRKLTRLSVDVDV